MTVTAAHECEYTWNAHAVARFWEPGADEWARKRLHLPGDAHITAAMLDSLGIGAYEENEGPTPGNLLTSLGLNTLTTQLIAGTKDWSTTFCGLAVGTDTTPATIGDIDLNPTIVGSRSYRVMDSGFPTANTGALRFFTTFAAGEANFSWDEYAVIVPFNGSASALGGSAVTTKPTNYTLLNRKAYGMGVKVSPNTASIDLTITIV